MIFLHVFFIHIFDVLNGELRFFFSRLELLRWTILQPRSINLIIPLQQTLADENQRLQGDLKVERDKMIEWKVQAVAERATFQRQMQVFRKPRLCSFLLASYLCLEAILFMSNIDCIFTHSLGGHRSRYGYIFFKCGYPIFKCKFRKAVKIFFPFPKKWSFHEKWKIVCFPRWMHCRSASVLASLLGFFEISIPKHLNLFSRKGTTRLRTWRRVWGRRCSHLHSLHTSIFREVSFEVTVEDVQELPHTPRAILLTIILKLSFLFKGNFTRNFTYYYFEALIFVQGLPVPCY